MFEDCLPMGCLSSRSTSVSPESGQARDADARVGANKDVMANGTDASRQREAARDRAAVQRDGPSEPGGRPSDKHRRITDIGTSLDNQSDSFQLERDGSKEYGELKEDERDKIMTMLMGGDGSDRSAMSPNNDYDGKSLSKVSDGEPQGKRESGSPGETGPVPPANQIERGAASLDNSRRTNASSASHVTVAITTDKSIDGESDESMFDDELNTDLLRQYIAVDFEISQLEDRDALRLYHEKIEQLEQLERELDMISFEAEEVANRNGANFSLSERTHLGGSGGAPNAIKDSRMDIESGSIISAASGSLSAKSSIVRLEGQQQSSTEPKKVSGPGSIKKDGGSKQASQAGARDTKQGGGGQFDKNQSFVLAKGNNLSYATIEEVFNRKIILEKERDKLKKEVEMVIVECDRLQHKYKKRDELLDKLFDGRTGNGLENHLEQQLNWLMEQKNYVDQVFYSWKRAETLTSQTCEQYASALELLKRLPKISNEEQRNELSKSVCDLLIKSRNDMEQAQRYNPNVDAPFFTDAETERFDKIIETIQAGSISQNDYNQMATVVQFAYKRAVSIRLWLEQILQITIARDSFELAEEYKWIAIQLRKERISLINLRLQDPPYRGLAQSIREQLASQHQRQLQLDQSSQLAITDSMAPAKNRQNEINRDSGIESDDIDIEEDIYRLLEMNRSRLEAAMAASREAGGPPAITLDASGRPVKLSSSMSSTSTTGRQLQQLSVAASSRATTGGLTSTSQHDQIMQERIQRRVRDDQSGVSMRQFSVGKRVGEPGGGESGGREMKETSPAGGRTVGGRPAAQGARGGDGSTNAGTHSSFSMTPSKLRVELDEESRRSLLKQVDQIHSKHRNRLDNLRGSNKAKANDILQRLQDSKRQTKAGNQNGPGG